jgi:hypothetical protein
MSRPHNNKMKLTRSAQHSVARPSQLILVLCRHLEIATVSVSLQIVGA